MHRLVVVAALVLGLSGAPAALALGSPPIGLGSLRIVKLKQDGKRTKSCSAHRRSSSAAGRVAKKLRPVACEQPPRSKVLDAGIAILLVP